MPEVTQEIPTDVAVEIVADHQRRNVLQYLAETEEETVTVDALASVLVADDSLRGKHQKHEAHVRSALHHTHLPKLAAVDVIEYSPDSGSVHYRSHESLEALEEFVDKTLD